MKTIQVQINPYLEFMNSILLTSRYNEMTETYIGYGLMTTEVNDYTSGIKQLFAKYSNAPIYPFIEELIPNGFSFGRPVEMMLCVKNKEFALKYGPSPLCVKYCGGRKKVNELLAKYKLPGFLSGYGDWLECVNEHLVRAMVIHLLKKCNLQEVAEEMLAYDLQNGYRYIPLILEKYKYYDENRNIFKNFETFYPELLGVFGDNCG